MRPSVVLIMREAYSNADAGHRLRRRRRRVNGSILTAYHVVAGPRTVTVRFFDGTHGDRTVDQQQPERDLAVST